MTLRNTVQGLILKANIPTEEKQTGCMFRKMKILK